MAATTFNIKCGVLMSDDQVSPHGYKFFTWTTSTLPSTSDQQSLEDRVKTFFPDVGHVFNVVCFDEDGDRISLPIGDVKETVAALFSLKPKNSAKPIRLCIQPYDSREPGNCVGQIHFGIKCANCTKKPIVGFRYRCRQCPNYDLCGRCEADGIHPEHDFIRMSHLVSEEAPTAVAYPVAPSADSLKRRPSYAQLVAIEQLGDRLIDQLTSLEQSLTGSLANIVTLLQGKEEGDLPEASMEELS